MLYSGHSTRQIPGNRHRLKYVCFLISGLFCLFVSSGCATVDSTLDKVTSSVSDRFGKKDDNADIALPAVEQEAPTAPEPERKPLLIEIQEKLRTLDYYSGPISGKLDSRSEAAIQDFQLDKNLRIDGRPTSALLDEIDKALDSL